MKSFSKICQSESTLNCKPRHSCIQLVHTQHKWCEKLGLEIIYLTFFFKFLKHFPNNIQPLRWPRTLVLRLISLHTHYLLDYGDNTLYCISLHNNRSHTTLWFAKATVWVPFIPVAIKFLRLIIQRTAVFNFYRSCTQHDTIYTLKSGAVHSDTTIILFLWL